MPFDDLRRSRTRHLTPLPNTATLSFTMAKAKPTPLPNDPLGAVMSVTNVPMTHAQCVALIGELDRMIGMARTFWIEARDDNERTKSMTRINGLLDERLRLMKARDEAAMTQS